MFLNLQIWSTKAIIQENPHPDSTVKVDQAKPATGQQSALRTDIAEVRHRYGIPSLSTAVAQEAIRQKTV